MTSENVKKIVTGKIDGKNVRVIEGTTVLEAAKSVGVEIPHFCFHPGIGIEGSCRMCLVEIKGNPKLQVSCNLAFAEGMEVLTDTPEVVRAQKGVLEFLLINHPLDCPICDKGGECPLQDYAFAYGPGKSRYEEQKRHLAKHNVLSDHIIFDQERCILCTRCIRYYSDIVGTGELIVEKRGHRSRVAAFKDKPLQNDFSGNLADICPVGALTTRDFRFGARAWEMKTYDSSCAVCGLYCSAQIWKKKTPSGPKIMRFTAEFDSGVNGWWLCDKGRFGFRSLLSGNRMVSCKIREADGHKELPMQEALDELGGILGDLVKRNGRESLKIISSCDITNEEAWMLKQIAETGERAGSVIFDIGRNESEFHSYLKSCGLGTTSFHDIESAKGMLFLGTDVGRTHPVLYLRLKETILKNRVNVVGTADFKFADERLISKRVEVIGSDKRGLIDEMRKKIRAGSLFADEKARSNEIAVFMDETWIDGSLLDTVKEFMSELKEAGLLGHVLLLKRDDFNTRGILDLQSVRFGFADEIKSVFSDAATKELVLIGDDVIAKVMSDQRFSDDKFDFICMVKKFDGQTTAKAHLAFPMGSFMEKVGTLTNVLGTVRKTKRVIEICREPVKEWKVLARLALELGSNVSYVNEEQVYEALAQSVNGYPKTAAKIRPAEDSYRYLNRELRK